MTMSLLLVAGLAILSATALATHLTESPGPVQMVISGQSLAFEAPPGYCAFDQGIETDRLAFEITARALAPENRLLAHFMNCEDYRRMHAGTLDRVGRFALVMIPGVQANSSPRHRGMSRAAFIGQLTEAFESEAVMKQVSGMIQQKFADLDLDHVLLSETLDENLTAEQRRILEQLRSDVLAGRFSFFPLDADNYAAYVGHSVPLEKEIQAGVGAVTLVNEIAIMISVYDTPARLELYEELKGVANWMVRKAIAASES
ncbi:MAG: hypothetical protein ACFCUQ_10150 [Kiloniellales bacterium]